MAISSIHIEGGSGGYFGHNSREAHTNNSIFNDEENYCSASKEEAFKLFREELKTRSQAYESRTGQKLQKNSTTHLSAIFNFNYETTPEQAHKVCEYLEKLLDTKVVQMSMHRDEGHIIEEESQAIHDKIKVNTAIKNYHGHIEFLGLDSQGNSIRRKLDKPMLREIQTEVAKILGMERGRQTSYNKEEYLKITNELKPQNEYADKKEYNKAFNEKAKELGLLKERKAKRLDTYEYKKLAETVATKVKEKEKEILATKDQLKDANNQLRTFMKENGALRTDFAQLEQAKKELEEKLKAKELTIEEMQDKFKEIEENFRREKGHLESVVELKEIEIDDLRTKNYQIETFSDNLENQNKVLISQNEILEEKVLSLEEKTAHSSNMSDYESMKEDLKSIDGNIETFENHFKLPKTGNLVKLMQWVETKFTEMKTQIKSLFKENEELKDEIENLKMKNEKLYAEKVELLMELGATDVVKNDDPLQKLVKNLEVATGSKSDSSILDNTSSKIRRER